MNLKTEWKPLAYISAVFLAFFYLPLESARFQNALGEALYLAKDYAREHVLLCLLPAFFIAGAIAVFVSQNAVMKYLGPAAKKTLAYGVAAVSGTILAVCSCTVLPLFAGIYRMGAGLGPACAFLYSGPAINVLAIILTARILGLELGIARAVGAIIFSIVIGFLMHLIFRREEMAKAAAAPPPAADDGRPLWQTAVYFAAMVGVLVFANWGKPAPAAASGLWAGIYNLKWLLTAFCGVCLGIILTRWFAVKFWKLLIAAAAVLVFGVIFPGNMLIVFTAGVVALAVVLASGKNEETAWLASTWEFAKQIMPLLLAGVLIAGLLLGRPGNEGLFPAEWVTWAVGGNSLRANFFAAFAGAFMYFATLTEVPILQGLIGNGMGKGPALALLLAGPALSLPNMLVIRAVLGLKKTAVFIALVVVMATISGIIFGALSA